MFIIDNVEKIINATAIKTAALSHVDPVHKIHPKSAKTITIRKIPISLPLQKSLLLLHRQHVQEIIPRPPTKTSLTKMVDR